MEENLDKLISEYKEMEKCLETFIPYLMEQDYAKGKLELVKMIIADLEKLELQF